MKIILITTFLLFSITAYCEETLCNKVESRGEGHWPLPEKAFTKERANKALETLAKFTSNGSTGADFAVVENELMYIKGYLLKSFLNSNDKLLLKEYCEFIENEAYVKH